MPKDEIRILFDEDDCDDAHADWGCNCGPVALAACLGMTLDAVRPHLGDFENRGYMSPTMMRHSIERCGAKVAARLEGWLEGFDRWPERGLARIQFTGPWTAPGSNPHWAYRYTHWVACWRTYRLLVYDINRGLQTAEEWEAGTVPLLTAAIDRADGGWFATHLWEVRAA